MANRKKKTIITGVTREAADEAFATFAKADAQCNKINADIELACAKIREKWADKLTVLQAERDAAFDKLQAFATEHPELFVKKKSLDMAHGVIGFRTGTPKLKTLKGFTWEAAKTLVKKLLPDYIRTTEEIAKDKMLADRDSQQMREGDPLGPGKPMSEAMAECGIQVVQNETFYVEPKKEDAS